MESNENSSTYTSHLRPPSKIPSTDKGLFEISNNARTAIPPPGTMSLKHRPASALPEPTPKRKTLAQRAGETKSGLPAPPSSRPVGSAVRAATLAGARNMSMTSSRVPAAASRGASASSFSKSMGPGSRPASVAGSSRPQTSMRHARGVPSTSVPTARPATSLESRSSEDEAAVSGKRKAWDTNGRLEDMEQLYHQLKDQMTGSSKERNVLEETVSIYKTRVTELEAIKTQLSTHNMSLQTDLETTKIKLSSTTNTLDEERRSNGAKLDDLQRQHRNDMEDARRHAQFETERLIRAHQEEIVQLERRLQSNFEDERRKHLRELEEAIFKGGQDKRQTEEQLEAKDNELQGLETELKQTTRDLEREKLLTEKLRNNLAETSASSLGLESSMRSLRAKIEFLESDSKAQSQCYADLEQRLQDALAAATEAKEKLRKEETLRRKLHNQVQELKGNIRVFCRVRPPISSEPENTVARLNFPDGDGESRELEVNGPEEKNSLGNVTVKKNAFAFDRVFAPGCQNADVFEEISQLVQSALDGYNVCIFCYGQTGSGKTHTMSSDDGMIPRAVHQIYDTAKSLEEKGWRYTMEGSFVEVYNETINDLLGKPEEFDKKKHEIRHDLQRCKTIITDVNTVTMDSPNKVESILQRATANRSVAATKANNRSSRSHSVFILKLIGENSVTGEKSEGTLNLVDLAGSERLSHSGATGERLRETQNINRSLSCLGDVIGALGQGKEGGHVPYRNSKLTYLLQFSLGGNSKTLMFVMISPLQAHLSETLTSLKFATKVHNTHIGTAKRQAKVKD
ncbi:kinesin-domain-containing protein [Xylona heveae TC161]|uniref:Kinesin-like protein n=1 Tax=Xylona heveae (strain CBS 132557 / TC161) TaxID=1328760 RepID=A0A165G3W6_XYLHT|nr:kinesin-domain-containing protein [Xylona heveae TC161]KZF21708.1 kinesin-domain-containing protein [Xylona heveae TC161]